MAKIEDLLGKTLLKVEQVGLGELIFLTAEGKRFHFYHNQECCESVTIEDIAGDLADLVGEPILVAEEVTSNQNPQDITKEYQDSFTWTFYKLATRKGYVTIRWYGESNGYYSERVTFKEIK
jgi:hypothetical protein